MPPVLLSRGLLRRNYLRIIGEHATATKMHLTSQPQESDEPPIDYRCSRVGRGWRASIFMPDAIRPLADSPSNLEKSDKNEIVAEAKRIIDAHLGQQGRRDE